MGLCKASKSNAVRKKQAFQVGCPSAVFNSSTFPHGRALSSKADERPISKMKLYTQDLHYSNIKISIARGTGSQKIDILDLNKLEPKFYLNASKQPVLQTESGAFIFSTNSICRYILSLNGKSQTNLAVDEWIEWESNHLLPVILRYLQAHYSSGKVSESLVLSLKNCLSHLNSFLAKSQTLPSNGARPGLANIVVWSTVHLLTGSPDIQLDSLESLHDWYCLHSKLPVFQNETVSAYSKDPAAFKDTILAALVHCVKEPSSPKASPQDSSESAASLEEIAHVCKWWNAQPSETRNRVEHPILPKDNERNVLVTSALPYVNNVPHLGNIIGAILSADVYARYCRLRNYNTLYICGTDEYGTATETKALEEGVTPQEICDKYNKLHSEIYQWFNIQFDFFGRTTTPEQTSIAQDIFWKLHKAGYILQDTVEQLFCEYCSRFLADRYVEGICPFCSFDDARGDQCDKCGKLVNPTELKKPRCKICQKEPRIKSSNHLFLDLPKLEPLLKTWLDGSTESGQWTTTAKVISYTWIRDGLKPRCITRDLKWGTPVPLEGFTDKVFYVWYDAPIGYLSITANYTKDWELWWKDPKKVQLFQFMAKDNVPFHGVIFPSCQLGTSDPYTIVGNLAAIEYLNYEDSKFSKSRGVGVFGNDAQSTGIPADIWRFYLLFIRPESQDTVFSWTDLMTKNNSELLNNLGNYANRALMFVYNNFNGVIPEMILTAEDKTLLVHVQRELTAYIGKLENLRLRDGIKHFLSVSRLGNVHIQSCKPWELVKGTPEERSRAGTVMGLSVNIACLLSCMMEPYMPLVSKELQNQLNLPEEKSLLTPNIHCLLPPGHKINKPYPLFKKLEQAEIDILRTKYAGKQDSPERSPSKTKKADIIQSPTVNGVPNVNNLLEPAEIDALTKLLTEQGEKVRSLKSQKAEKAVIDKEVEQLLLLKKKLAEATGQNPEPEKKKRSKKK